MKREDSPHHPHRHWQPHSLGKEEVKRLMQRRSKGDGTEMQRRCKVWGIPQYILYDNDNDDDNYE